MTFSISPSPPPPSVNTIATIPPQGANAIEGVKEAEDIPHAQDQALWNDLVKELELDHDPSFPWTVENFRRAQSPNYAKRSVEEIKAGLALSKKCQQCTLEELAYGLTDAKIAWWLVTSRYGISSALIEKHDWSWFRFPANLLAWLEWVPKHSNMFMGNPPIFSTMLTSLRSYKSEEDCLIALQAILNNKAINKEHLNINIEHSGFFDYGDYDYSFSRMSALHVAAIKGQADVVKLLLAEGANPHQKSKRRAWEDDGLELTALDLVNQIKSDGQATEGHEAIIQCLQQYEDKTGENTTKVTPPVIEILSPSSVSSDIHSAYRQPRFFDPLLDAMRRPFIWIMYLIQQVHHLLVSARHRFSSLTSTAMRASANLCLRFG